MMRKFLILPLIVLGTSAFSGKNIPKLHVSKGEHQNSLTYRVSNNRVFSVTPQKGKDVSFNTITAKKGFISSRFTSHLGKFEDAKKFGCNLQITRQTENPKFEVGTYNIAGPEIIVDAFVSDENKTFAVVNVISIKEYKLLAAINQLGDLKNKFVFQLNPNNKLVIEKTENITELNIDSTGNFKVGSQLLKGYALIHLMEVNSGELFSIRLDFNVINNIRLRI